MDDLMNKIQNILNDKESMKQIQELASMLSNENSNQSDINTSSLSDILNNLDQSEPQENNKTSNNTKNNNDFDISKLLALNGILSQAQKSDKNIDFLIALRPLLKTENQIKIDRLIKLFKLFAIYPLIKESGIIGGDLFDLL